MKKIFNILILSLSMAAAHAMEPIETNSIAMSTLKSLALQTIKSKPYLEYLNNNAQERLDFNQIDARLMELQSRDALKKLINADKKLISKTIIPLENYHQILSCRFINDSSLALALCKKQTSSSHISFFQVNDIKATLIDQLNDPHGKIDTVAFLPVQKNQQFPCATIRISNAKANDLGAVYDPTHKKILPQQPISDELLQKLPTAYHSLNDTRTKAIINNKDKRLWGVFVPNTQEHIPLDKTLHFPGNPQFADNDMLIIDNKRCCIWNAHSGELVLEDHERSIANLVVNSSLTRMARICHTSASHNLMVEIYECPHLKSLITLPNTQKLFFEIMKQDGHYDLDFAPEITQSLSESQKEMFKNDKGCTIS